MDMKHSLLTAVCLTAAALFISCESNKYGPTGHGPKPEKPETPELAEGFAKGADISWVTQMEKDGVKFYNAEGKETECTAVMKEAGFDAIRLRVWFDPEGGWCGKDDVLVKAKRAHDLGMKLMIDFHYSDYWADPGKQNPPAAWSGYGAAEMTAAVASHTKDVLKALKGKGIDVTWVQVGNEVTGGMLWPLGKVKDQSTGSFIDFLDAGYAAAKEIYPDSKVILHIDNGYDSGLYDWFFGLMKAGNARYDIIGMSLYPSYAGNDWNGTVDRCMTNIKAVTAKFGKPVMICETGLPVSDPRKSRDTMQYIMDNAMKTEGCLGVFYWEPQTDGVWKPSNYEALGWQAYGLGAFKDGRPTAILDPFGNKK